MNEPQYHLRTMGRVIPHRFIQGAINEGKQLGVPFTVSLIATGMVCCSRQLGQTVEYTKAYQRWFRDQNYAGATRKVREVKVR